MINDEEMMEKFKKLKIDEVESKIFLYLLRMGPSRAGAITSSLYLDRNIVYRTLVKLRNKGLVSSTFSNPPLYLAINPEEAIRTVLLRMEQDFVTTKNTGYEIIENLQKIKQDTTTATGLNTFTIIQGKKNVLTKIAKIIKNAKNPIYLITTEEELARMYHTTIPDEIKSLAKKTDVKMILSGFERSTEFLDSFSPTELRFSKLPSTGIIILEQERQLLMSGTNNENIPDGDYAVFYTNNSGLLSNIEYLCKNLWSSAKSLKSLLRKIEVD